MIVVDASAMLEWLLQAEAAEVVEKRLFDPEQMVHAPHLIDVEIAHVLRRSVLKGELDPVRGGEALADLADFPMYRYPHDMLLPRIWELRNNLTAYDASYVALAETLEAALLTSDRRLAAAAGHHARIELVLPATAAW